MVLSHSMKKRLFIISLFIFILSSFSACTNVQKRNISYQKKVSEKITSIENRVEARLNPYLARAGINNLPSQIAILAFKNENNLELWGYDNKWRLIKKYEILAASGVQGPKLREGDRQVPEGIYSISYLNPDSKYYLSMGLNYPNEFDLKQARKEKRANLGGEIMIHGKNVSRGCIAIGDEAIEELFYITAKVGIQNTKVLIAPYDMRSYMKKVTLRKSWVGELYRNLASELKYFYKRS